MRLGKLLCSAAPIAVASMFVGTPLAAWAGDIVNTDPDRPLCATHEVWVMNNPELASSGVADACPLQGDCDNPTVRNAFIPSAATPIKTLRLRIHAFANTNGSNPASTLTEIGQQVAKLNADYLPYRIQFTYTAEIINDSTYRDFTPYVEDSAMKNLYADSPATQLNVYVTNVNCCYSGLGTFPWDPNSQTNLGGIIIDDDSFDATNEVLTHEVGHCIGLWHTHHGVSEVDPCSACHEYAPSGSNTTGDFCADTPPTKTESYGACSGSGGSDSCNGIAWDPQPENFMGYAGPPCWSLFTPQQAGRMHCWITAELAGWVVGGVDPCPSAGSCFATHANTGCDNADCCDAVCGIDPFCCGTTWDSVCVNEANDLCTGCGGAGVGSCFSSHTGPYCDVEVCCTAVCAVDAFCCNSSWDSICAGEAATICNTCGGAGANSCYVSHPTPHCNDAACCDTVCAVDSYCCSNQWDSVCVNEALDLCDPPVMAGPIVNPTNGNKYYLIGLASWPRANTKAGSLGGHLATITNSTENEWVRANLANYGGVPREVWIGLTDTASEGTFVWVTGEPLSYTHWNSGEPNDSGGNEDYVEMFPTAGLWNDVGRYAGNNNYGVVELEVYSCGDPDAGDCYSAHGTPYCNVAACCNTVCAIDSFCCNTAWDSICAGEADDYCAPENDSCGNAITIVDGFYSFDNIHATTDGLANATCSYFGTDQIYSDVWYRWVAPCTGQMTVSTCGMVNFDTKIAIYGETAFGFCGCPSTNPLFNAPMIGCADDTAGCTGNSTVLTVNVVAGDCYTIRIGSYSSVTQGSGTFSVVCGVPNDDCAYALPILNGATQFSNVGATTDGPAEALCDVSSYNQIGSDIWYVYNATCTGTLTVSTCGAANFDTKIAVYGENVAGACNCPGSALPPPILGCNDDVLGCSSFTSSLSVAVTAGNCYKIRVGGYQAAQGSGTLTLTCEACVGDINGDGIVNASDLGIFLGAWGAGAGSPADLDGNGIVNATDLGILLGAWGPC
ncbi:MAG: lectin-like protein [Phycisphaerales bacterium]